MIDRRVPQLVAVVACAFALWPVTARAQPADATTVLRDELARLRQEFDAMREEYQKRMADIEARLAAVEGGPATGAAASAPLSAPATPPDTQPAAPPAPSAQVPAGAAGSGGPEGALPVYGNTSALSKIFNPDLAVIGNFIGAAGKNEIENRPALSMDEAEFSFQAVVDPYARADFFVAAGPDEVELEEGYITLTSLPGGVLAKVGKMKAQFGKTNTLHPHQLPWADQPLVLENLLGSEEGLNDSGVSVSKLLMNPWVFLEATGEIFQGNNATFQSYTRSDLTYLGRLRAYRDVTESTNIDVGSSFAFGRNQLGENSRTRLFGIDATFRYRPLRGSTYRRLLGRAEFVWNRATNPLENDEGEERTTAFGMYAGGDYQFARRWFAGARVDYAERAFEPSLRDKGASFLLTFWPSEFSQVRGQYRRMKYAEGNIGNEVLVQFLFSIGAHGAHIF